VIHVPLSFTASWLRALVLAMGAVQPQSRSILKSLLSKSLGPEENREGGREEHHGCGEKMVGAGVREGAGATLQLQKPCPGVEDSGVERDREATSDVVPGHSRLLMASGCGWWGQGL
jgi:hypothetical protein